ncbi:MAG: NYN domain-containing protein [Armatimonadota bacterium]
MASKDINHIDELKQDIKEIVNGIDPRAMLIYLKDHEWLAAHILVGFRANAASIKMPAVRNRIHNEAEKDDAFLETLGMLLLTDKLELREIVSFESASNIKKQLDELISKNGRLAVKVALLVDDRQNVRALVKYLKQEVPPETAEVETRPVIPIIEDILNPPREIVPAISVKELNAEKAAKEKIRKQEQRISDLEKTVESLKSEKIRKDTDIKTLKAEISDFKKNLVISEKQADRQRRENEKTKQDKSLLEEEIKSLKRSIRDLQAELAASKAAKTVDDSTRTPDWLPIIKKMISGSNTAAAKSFCKTLCNLNGNSIHAHLILRDLYARTGDKENELNECINIAVYFKDNSQFNRSFSYLCDALELDQKNTQIHALFHQSMNVVDTKNVNLTEMIRRKLVKMRLDNPPAYRQASKIVKSFGSAYEKVFFDKPEILHPDKVVEFSDGKASKQLSIRDVINAIDLNDKLRVDFIKRSLKYMKKQQPDTYMKIIKSVANVDESCTDVLNSLGETVIVDGSNVAWHDVMKPRFENIIQIRNILRASGYFPILLYFDAALVYQIDRQAELMKMAESGAMIAADIKTDADGSIIDHAGRLNCPVVTNDRMLDWDPNGTVQKIRFNISKSGAEIYD